MLEIKGFSWSCLLGSISPFCTKLPYICFNIAYTFELKGARDTIWNGWYLFIVQCNFHLLEIFRHNTKNQLKYVVLNSSTFQCV